MMDKIDTKASKNPLIRAFKEQYMQNQLATLLGEYANEESSSELMKRMSNKKQVVSDIEKGLSAFISGVKPNQYSDKEIIEFYENISLRRNVWISFFDCQDIMKELNFRVLTRSRF
jgi:hypothetical protein